MQFAIICHGGLTLSSWVLIRAAGLADGLWQAKAGPVVIATISLPGTWRGKDYSDYELQTERFFPKFFILRDSVAGGARASPPVGRDRRATEPRFRRLAPKFAENRK
ncbi:hypothetical protein [Agrobacterium sp. ICMP 6402]|uniref:hypothetical protein n=1 Tax=Agrobacterium sp. ICMP 6402 TaxID=2292443 RepID=UPI0012958361|nr:hypothetical protein [Agrobacterium sp. ICMP 6402]